MSLLQELELTGGGQGAPPEAGPAPRARQVDDAPPEAPATGGRQPNAGAAPDLLGLRETAARVIGARHRGRDGEDLAQEAWVRVVEALRTHPVADPGSYTAGVAANLVRAECRRAGARERRAPRLYARPSLDHPELEVLRHEERDAITAALSRLPSAARDLLVAHTVHDIDTATLAAIGGTTPAAVAAALARARAMLRVEYVLAFRHLPPPDDRCRRVLYAISGADARRMGRLDAGNHVRACATCRSVTAVLRERRRPSVAAALALRWGRLARWDWTGAGQRAGLTGGLISAGLVGALAIGAAVGPLGGAGTGTRPAAAAASAVAGPPSQTRTAALAAATPAGRGLEPHRALAGAAHPATAPITRTDSPATGCPAAGRWQDPLALPATAAPCQSPPSPPARFSSPPPAPLAAPAPLPAPSPLPPPALGATSIPVTVYAGPAGTGVRADVGGHITTVGIR